jgi:hypothetical protein
MRTLIAVLAVAVPLAQAGRTLACDDDETTVFSCGMENEYRSISLCGTGADQDEPNRQLGLRYVYQTENDVEMSYPPDPRDAGKLLFFAHWFENGLYHSTVRFENGGFSYRLFYRDTPPSENPDEITGPDVGVEIYKSDERVGVVACGERPEWLADQIRLSTACDSDNPHGEAACAETAPEYP